jgi:hypothetical protein
LKAAAINTFLTPGISFVTFYIANIINNPLKWIKPTRIYDDLSDYDRGTICHKERRGS